MKLVVGLGNPGKKYENTRHNVGYMVVDRLVAHLFVLGLIKAQFSNDKKFHSEIIKTDNIVFIKPDTFMNNSGLAVSKVFHYFNVDLNDTYIIHDDLDIRLGEYKIQRGKGPKDHGGLHSIYEKLGSKDFWHVRTGVENRDSGNRIAGEDYVLSQFSEDEKKTIEDVGIKIINDLKVRLFENEVNHG